MARSSGKDSGRTGFAGWPAWLLAAAVVASLSIGGYLWRTATVSAPGPGTWERVTIAVSAAYPGSCPIFVALEHGDFASEGLQVDLQRHSSGREALKEVLAGRTDLATASDLPVMFAALSGQPIAVIATIFRSENDHGILARKDRGIASVSDLRGKRIGVTKGTSAHFFLDTVLSRARLGSDEVTLVDLKADAIAEAIAKGEVDAVATWQPILQQAQAALAAAGTVFHDAAVSTLTWNLVGRRDDLKQRVPTLQKLLRAVDRGARVCREMPDQAMPILARATSIDVDELKQFWRSYRFNVTLDQGLLLALEDEARWAIEKGLSDRKEMPNFLEHIALDALKSSRPEAVTLIH